MRSRNTVCVQRTPDGNDRRAMRVTITQQGRAFRDRLVAIADEIVEFVLDDLSPHERATLLRGLDVVAQAAETGLRSAE